MLLPHELKNKPFSRAMRGYSISEVDSYVDFLIEKYTELYRENDELERKLAAALSKLDEFAAEESPKTSAAPKSDVPEEAIYDAIKRRCDAEIADTVRRVDEGRAALADMRRTVENFRSDIYREYLSHIKRLEKIDELSAAAVIPERDLAAEIFAGAVSDLEGESKSTAPEAVEEVAVDAVDAVVSENENV